MSTNRGCPSWTRIEPCAWCRRRNSGACLRTSDRCGSPPDAGTPRLTQSSPLHRSAATGCPRSRLPWSAPMPSDTEQQPFAMAKHGDERGGRLSRFSPGRRASEKRASAPRRPTPAPGGLRSIAKSAEPPRQSRPGSADRCCLPAAA